METLRRPELVPGRIHVWRLVGEVLMVLGFAGIVLGIYEIGDVFVLGLGFALVWAGMIVSFRQERRRREREDEAFRWVVTGPDGVG
jgi:uncharacterized membrane protein